MMKKFIYIVSSTFDSDEKNYEIGTHIDSAFLKKSDANKRVKKLEKEHEELDECVSVFYSVDKLRIS